MLTPEEIDAMYRDLLCKSSWCEVTTATEIVKRHTQHHGERPYVASILEVAEENFLAAWNRNPKGYTHQQAHEFLAEMHRSGGKLQNRIQSRHESNLRKLETGKTTVQSNGYTTSVMLDRSLTYIMEAEMVKLNLTRSQVLRRAFTEWALSRGWEVHV